LVAPVEPIGMMGVGGIRHRRELSPRSATHHNATAGLFLRFGGRLGFCCLGTACPAATVFGDEVVAVLKNAYDEEAGPKARHAPQAEATRLPHL
jgi:hypothetical protein